jgi:hypothetical protein
LNTGDADANVEFFQDRGLVGLYRFVVLAQRTNDLLFNDLNDPARVPRNTPYASTIVSNVPIFCQHTRLDSRQAENALMSKIAYASSE